MSEAISRRRLLLGLAATCAWRAAAAGEPGAAAGAASAKRLDPRDPAALALGYVADATRVNPAREPGYAPGHRCENCLQLQGRAGETYRPCGAFGGQLVSVSGWCRAWTPEM